MHCTACTDTAPLHCSLAYTAPHHCTHYSTSPLHAPPPCTALHSTAQHCINGTPRHRCIHCSIAQHCTALHCTALHYTIPLNALHCCTTALLAPLRCSTAPPIIHGTTPLHCTTPLRFAIARTASLHHCMNRSTALQSALQHHTAQYNCSTTPLHCTVLHGTTELLH